VDIEQWGRERALHCVHMPTLLGDSPKNVSRHAASAESASACIAAKSTSSTCVERKDREDH
jgi:hypothetical protein